MPPKTNMLELSTINPDGPEMLVELDWIVSDDTVVRPDVIVVCGEPPERHLEHAPAIAVEVPSDSTRMNDLGYKRNLYQQHGIAAYIIIDPQDRAVTLDRRQSDCSYQTKSLTEAVTLEICADCTLQFSIETLFRGSGTWDEMIDRRIRVKTSGSSHGSVSRRFERIAAGTAVASRPPHKSGDR